MKKTSPYLRLSLLAAALFAVASARAVTLTVTDINDGGVGTLRDTINAASAGDTVDFLLPPGSVIELTSGELLIDKDLTIKGPGANLLTVQRSASSSTPNFRIFDVTASGTVRVSGITIANGNATSGTGTGGGIYTSAASLVLSNVAITGSQAAFGGGGIHNANSSGTVTMIGCTISGNSTGNAVKSTAGGGGMLNAGTVNVDSSTISGNSSAAPGGGVTGGTIGVSSSTITANTATEGGGVRISGSLVMENSIVALNTGGTGADLSGTATSLGFNLIGTGAGATISAKPSDQIGVSAAQLKLGPLQDNGGPTMTHALGAGSVAIDRGKSFGYFYDQRGLARAVDSPTIPNQAGGDGSDIGAYEVQPQVLAGCKEIDTVVSNSNDSGAGSLRDLLTKVCAGSTITFADSVRGTIALTTGELLLKKSVTIRGPGANLLSVRRSSASGTPSFRIFHGTGAFGVTLFGLTIANGSSNNLGGGGILNNGGLLNVTNCAINGNTATGALRGGGIYDAGGTLILTNSTISGNTAGSGGGIWYYDGAATIINSTITGNTAPSAGGGILADGGVLELISSTVVSNTSGMGGGIYTDTHDHYGFPDGGTTKARNSIVALNNAPASPDIFNVFYSRGFNFIGKNSGASIVSQPTDQIGNAAAPKDPLLDSLKDNGGPTKTRALLAGSSAIDAGDSSGLQTDQRGFSRPVNSPTVADVGDGSDIGAFEVQPDQLAGCAEINLVVSNNNDSGTGSLRSVIANACAGSTITFAPSVRGAITLTSGELLIHKNLTINGPGANLLSVQRSTAAGTSNFRIFEVDGEFTVAISGLTIAHGNLPNDNGGGIYSVGTLTVSNCTVSANASGYGGGIYVTNTSRATITGCTISGNSATYNGSGGGFGGGVFNFQGTVTIESSTISGNTAMNGGYGGGIFTSEGAMTLLDSTVVGNSAGVGGGIRTAGIFYTPGPLVVRNTIVALNGGGDINGAVTSEGFNVIGSGSGATISPTQSSDRIGATAAQLQFGPLQYNGGPTQTRALLAGSVAINAGDNADAPPRDQRGYVRSDRADVGAYEFGATIPVTLANISTRLAIQGGDNVLISGFILAGTQPKKLIVRGLGPSLPVAGALADPVLEIYNSANQQIAKNDNWRANANAAEIQASGVAPTKDAEAAILGPASPGAYTAIERGANGSTGIGLLDLYDLDRTVDSRLVNISTRGLVQTGDDVMIGGFIVLGVDPERAIIRALGPSLPIADSLPNPKLELRDQNGALIQSNDNWKSNQQAEIQATGIPPPNDLESAIVATLEPGAYTAVVRDASGKSGVALVEVYALN